MWAKYKMSGNDNFYQFFHDRDPEKCQHEVLKNFSVNSSVTVQCFVQWRNLGQLWAGRQLAGRPS